ncbi:MAG: hypothetical protein EPO22_03180 [Dehalococcoidia bacterium]|nr:MAG: hypothetical protein EPO22_03180 [Dehalococcoidia bacterium]
MLAVVGGGITWWINQSSSNYASRTADIVNATTERINKLDSESTTDQALCAAGSIPACDRLMAMLSRAADEVAAARTDLAALEPPSDAQSWHNDYLAFLRDGEYALRGSVAAWNSGNLRQFENLLAEFDGLTAREDQLTTYFNSHLR